MTAAESDSDAAGASQAEISREIAAAAIAYERGDVVETEPLLDYPAYRSSRLRHPLHELLLTDPEEVELATPVYGRGAVDAAEADLTLHPDGAPIGERIIVTGRVVDADGRPIRRQLVEIWQANSAGRYIHQRDQHDAPLDPHFVGAGRALTDDDGRYTFTTIKPGPYPWRNHRNAWRPAHIHFSLFGSEFTQRLVTQMYFPGDPLFGLDPIFQSVRDPQARERLIATYAHDVTRPEWATGYEFDIVLTGAHRTPFEEAAS